MKKRILTTLIAMVMTISITAGCSTADENTIPEPASSQNSLEQPSPAADDPLEADPETLSSSDAANPAQTSQLFILPAIPDYSGEPYATVNDGIPFFTDAEKQQTASFEQYAPLDSMGRCGTAIASIGPDLMPTEPRGSIGQVKPSGWHTVKYDCVDGKYLYNRCHLIGYQLTAENANTSNLITGTRYLNTEGMLPFENMTADYIKETGNHVLYRVTPVFEDDNLVASGVLMEGWSVEDKGEGICFNVFCYNVQPGVTIDYAAGDSTADPATPASEPAQEAKPAPPPVPKPAPEPEPEPEPVPKPGTNYILNTNSYKFHYPSCSSVDQMKESNKEYYTGSREDLIARGYDPCGRCHP